ncbi:hypothetical protein F1C10_06530 [Sphingomonas sp. NBWT7]|uniref:hypothetical protein n=1 Tax=Sphingomonas sp. NBWT7 TaxID=2596913 RepID=UPI001629A002|nr:hypothetical protein [Sphingomonas sp. NBWT7]QNE31620.1 hypothetical protein F1C10_06530 [Sphingomonas sp. NBWT7]
MNHAKRKRAAGQAGPADASASTGVANAEGAPPVRRRQGRGSAGISGRTGSSSTAGIPVDAAAPDPAAGARPVPAVALALPPGIRLRHPMEILPFRPQPRPAWSPPRRDRRDAGQPRPMERPDRQGTRLVADRGLGAVRINFRYASFQSMTAAFSEKAGRDQYFEGPHETFGFRRDEVDPVRTDIQYQPVRIKWTTVDGRLNWMTLDWGVELQDGTVVFGEDKACEDYFADPELDERLDFAEEYLAEHGARLERRVAGGLPTALERRVVKDIFDARRTEYDEAHAARVRTAILASGGTTSLCGVIAAIGEHPRLSLDIARAMMFDRLVSMPLTAPPMPDTPVTIPPPAKRGALRAFLARHVPA